MSSEGRQSFTDKAGAAVKVYFPLATQYYQSDYLYSPIPRRVPLNRLLTG